VARIFGKYEATDQQISDLQCHKRIDDDVLNKLRAVARERISEYRQLYSTRRLRIRLPRR